MLKITGKDVIKLQFKTELQKLGIVCRWIITESAIRKWSERRKNWIKRKEMNLKW